MEKRRSEGRKKKKGLWWKVALVLLTFLIIGSATYVYSVYNDTKQTVEKKMHEPVNSIDTSIAKKKVEEKGVLNILLLGVDERGGDRGRSDALMVLSLNPETDEMQLISIPRDTRTEIVGKGFEDKINHAYAFGGTDMSVNTVENFLDIELDYYVKVNMEGLADMVDAVGGITVDNKSDWYDEGYYKKGYHYARGELQMNGPQTMGFVRMRHYDSDFARADRQRQVIQAIMDKGASVASVNKIDSILDVLGNNLATNLDFEDMTDLLQNYRNTRNNVVSYQMEGQGTYIKNASGQNIYYLMVSEEEIQKVNKMLRKS